MRFRYQYLYIICNILYFVCGICTYILFQLQFMGYKCFHFLLYTFLYFPNIYTDHILSLASEKKKVLFLKIPTYFEMNNMLHLDHLLLLIWSTGAHYIISIISQSGLGDLFPGWLQNHPGWSPPPGQLRASGVECCPPTTLTTPPCFKRVSAHPSFTSARSRSWPAGAFPFWSGLPSQSPSTPFGIQVPPHGL